MALLSNQPLNPNFLTQTNMQFTLKRAPNVVFFGFATRLPTIRLDVAMQPTAFINVPRPGTKVHYEDFTFRFIVDEDMRNYEEIYNWINDLGFPDDFSGYPRLEKTDGVHSDASLFTLTSKKNPNREFVFRDMFPVELGGGMDLTVQADRPEVVTCDVTFKYQRFYLKPLDKK